MTLFVCLVFVKFFSPLVFPVHSLKFSLTSVNMTHYLAQELFSQNSRNLFLLNVFLFKREGTINLCTHWQRLSYLCWGGSITIFKTFFAFQRSSLK